MEIDAPFYFNVACPLNCAKYKISIQFFSRAVDGPCTDGHICCRKQDMASKVLNMAADCPVQLDRSSQDQTDPQHSINKHTVTLLLFPRYIGKV